MNETLSVTLEYSGLVTVIQKEYMLDDNSLNKLRFGALVATQGAQIWLNHAPDGVIKISLYEDGGHPGGLERAVGECAKIIIPLSAIREYNQAGLDIATRVLTGIGYEFEPKPEKGVMKVSKIPEPVKRILEAVTSS